MSRPEGRRAWSAPCGGGLPALARPMGLALLVLGLAGCTGWRAPRLVSVTLPDAYLRADSTGVVAVAVASASAGDSAADRGRLHAGEAGEDGDVHGGRWWSSLGDPLLSELIEAAFDQNLTLQQALARLDQYRSQQRMAGSTWFPTVTGQVTATEREPVEASDGEAVVLPGGIDLSKILQESTQPPTYSVNLAAAYELDVWGRLAAGRAAAMADLRASEHDLEAVAISLAAQVARSYYAVAELQLHADLLDRTIGAFLDAYELVETRYRRGVSSLLDVYQAETSLSGARAQRILVRGQLAQAEHALAVLLGQPPQPDLLSRLSAQASSGGRLSDSGPAAGSRAGRFPDSLWAVPAGLPSDLLQRRPDVRAAYWRLRAADRRAAEAAAQRLPTLSLTGSLGGSSDKLGETLDPENMVWNAIGNLVLPVFEGGRRKANQDRAEAAWRVHVADYKERILQALREVEDALAAEAMQRDYLRELAVQEVAAGNTLVVATDRYLKGLVDYLTVTTAQTAYFNAQRNRISARRALLFARIGLLTALGGDWAEAFHAGSEESTEKAPMPEDSQGSEASQSPGHGQDPKRSQDDRSGQDPGRSQGPGLGQDTGSSEEE